MGGNSPSSNKDTLSQLLSTVNTPKSLVAGKAEMPFPSSKTSDQEDYNTKIKQQLRLPEVPPTAFLEAGGNQLTRPPVSLAVDGGMSNQKNNLRPDFASLDNKSALGGK